MSFRIALLGIYHESNTFVTDPTTLTDFHNGHYLKGDAIRNEYQNAHHEIGDMIELLDREGMELVPVLFAEATPGGTISSGTYKSLLDDMMAGWKKSFLLTPAWWFRMEPEYLRISRIWTGIG